MLRLVLAPWLAHRGDLGTFVMWAQRLDAVGPGHFYQDYWCDYLPGYLYVLWLLGKVAHGLGQPGLVLVFKLPGILADVATAYLLWRWLRPSRRDRKLWVAAIYLFNPAVLMNATLWGQADSFHALCLVGGLILLSHRRAAWAAVVLGYAAAVKPHTIVILPLAALYGLSARIGWHRVVACLIVVCVVFVATFVPFNHWSLTTLPAFVQARIATTMHQYEHATVNALNLWYLLGRNFKPDGSTLAGPLTYRTAGTLLFAVCYLVALGWYGLRHRRYGDRVLWESASIILLATFLFLTRVHERHLFAYFPAAAVVTGLIPAAVVPYALLSATYTVNLVFSWLWLEAPSGELCHATTGAVLCWLNLLSLPLVLLAYTGPASRWFERLRGWLSRLGRSEPACDSARQRRRTRLLLTAIVVFALSTRVIRLNAPNERYYDEVYHAYTAEQLVQGNREAWLWNRQAPEPGCAYEWTHPPLAKLAMAASMKLLGPHPWAWRLPAALLGTLSVLLVFLIARTLFQSERIALLAAALSALDALPLVMSRIGMNDIYSMTFVLAAVAAALHRRYVLSALGAGAALACKWSGLFALPLLLVIHLLRVGPRDRWRVAHLARLGCAYAVAVPGVYLASYIPFFQAGYGTDEFTQLQKQMWFYHTRLTAKHPFASAAWQWPIARKTIWCYTSTGGAGESPASQPETRPARPQANVYAVGNPVIWFSGLGALALAAVHVLRHRDPQVLVVLVGYLVFWAPWLASPRIMFITHYLLSLPFLYIALAWAMVHTKATRAHLGLLLIAAAVALALMYPYLTAWPMPPALAPSNWR